MLKATHTYTTGCVVAPSRRQFGASALAAACGAAFAGAILLPDSGEAFLVAVSPDAELLRLCAECDALQAKVDALWAGNRTHGMTVAQSQAFEAARDLEQQPFLDAQDPLLERIVAFRATTRQGQAARARTLLCWDKDPAWTQGGGWNDLLLGAIVRDLVEEG